MLHFGAPHAGNSRGAGCSAAETVGSRPIPERPGSGFGGVLVSDGFSYRADLATTGLPEVLAVVERCPLPGVLTVTRSGMVKHVFSRDGHVVYATSSDPVDRLAEYVRRAGLVGEELIDSLDQARSNSSRRLGVLLVERGLLSPREVYEAICRQVEAIVWSLFEWRTGTAEFEPGEAGEDVVQVKLPVRRVVFEGLKRAPAPGHDGDAARVVEPSFSYEELIDIGVGPVGAELVSPRRLCRAGARLRPLAL